MVNALLLIALWLPSAEFRVIGDINEDRWEVQYRLEERVWLEIGAIGIADRHYYWYDCEVLPLENRPLNPPGEWKYWWRGMEGPVVETVSFQSSVSELLGTFAEQRKLAGPLYVEFPEDWPREEAPEPVFPTPPEPK